jgi:1,4-alpha-glucan branching enzyme
MILPQIVINDPWLGPYAEVIKSRQERAVKKERELTRGKMSLNDFATGHLYFGLHRVETGWVFREWAPNAKEVYLIGEFSGWKPLPQFALKKLTEGKWEVSVPADQLRHGDLYKLLIRWDGGEGERIPAWCRRTVQDDTTKIFNAQVWLPEESYKWQFDNNNRDFKSPLIYEAHIGMATEEGKIGTYNEFRINVLPQIAMSGYNTIQLMAIQEHPYYGSFGYHVSSFFAPSSRFGTSEELKALVDEAHRMGVAVIMDIVHSHSVKNVIEGLGLFDGTLYQYFHKGARRLHVAWDSLCFDYGKNEVIHFLLSNCKYWLEEFHFDGFRFDGVTSMLYLDHGLSRHFTNYKFYFDGNQDEDAIVYMILANNLIHTINPDAITIAEEVSGMPGTANPVSFGGIGFDFRMAMGTPDYWIKIIKELPDEKWNVGQIFYELTNKRKDEKTIGYVESHDQALVGDKTIIFRLIDKEMYFSMTKTTRNLVVDRGIALHKMIRLVTIATAGNGYLNFMGNEFGHPEWIDFPREGNNWSFHYARRQWSLAKDKNLKYSWLGDFDKDMIDLAKNEMLFDNSMILLCNEDITNQVLAFMRGDLIFVFNFNPSHSFTDYAIKTTKGKFHITLNTDSSKYGGQDLVDVSMPYYTVPIENQALADSNHLKLYLPSRTAIVLKKEKIKTVYEMLEKGQ